MSLPDEGTAMAEGAGTPTHNLLLDMLPNGERTKLVTRMHRRAITPHDMLHAPGQPQREVYFPVNGVISLMTPLEDGTAIETATIGREGMVGVHAFLGGGPLGNAQAMSQVPGEMLFLGVDTFRAMVEGDGKLRTSLESVDPFRKSFQVSAEYVSPRLKSRRRHDDAEARIFDGKLVEVG